MEDEPYWHIKIFTEWFKAVALKIYYASELPLAY